MTQAISLHFALDYVNKNYYGNEWYLAVSSNDAKAYREIAMAQGYRSCLFCNAQATVRKFNEVLQAAASTLKRGDYLFVSFSGHGTQMPDLNGDEKRDDENDRLDEAWCFYDGIVIDDQLDATWQKFRSGVRILVVSGSCYSGTILRDSINIDPYGTQVPYTGARSSNLNPYAPRTTCRVHLLAAAEENQRAVSGRFYSRYTEQLLHVWNDGKFTGAVQDFHNSIKWGMPASRRPIHLKVGMADKIFDQSPPFTINPK